VPRGFGVRNGLKYLDPMEVIILINYFPKFIAMVLPEFGRICAFVDTEHFWKYNK
jgi:hypothetical protein